MANRNDDGYPKSRWQYSAVSIAMTKGGVVSTGLWVSPSTGDTTTRRTPRRRPRTHVCTTTHVTPGGRNTGCTPEPSPPWTSYVRYVRNNADENATNDTGAKRTAQTTRRPKTAHWTRTRLRSRTVSIVHGRPARTEVKHAISPGRYRRDTEGRTHSNAGTHSGHDGPKDWLQRRLGTRERLVVIGSFRPSVRGKRTLYYSIEHLSSRTGAGCRYDVGGRYTVRRHIIYIYIFDTHHGKQWVFGGAGRVYSEFKLDGNIV